MKICKKQVVCVLSTVFLMGYAGCGVKGKPLPPEEPVPIGHGQDGAPVEPVKMTAPTVITKPQPETAPKTKKTPAKSKIKQ